MTSAESVAEALRLGAAANRSARCRSGSIDIIEAPGELIATGDLHDNPIHFEKLVRLANLHAERDPATPPRHLTLHEIIHSDRLFQGMDMSYRALVRVAALKAAFPEHVHTLLGNHELAQLTNSPVLKDGVRCVEAFKQGVAYVFGDDEGVVEQAVNEFIASMPLALEVHTPRGVILCAHSVPAAAAMGRFDTSVLRRDLTSDDYQPRVGAAHLMTWGRGYDGEGLEDLVERWGVYMFILGHEKAEDGVKFVPPNAIVLASDHERGTYLPIDLSQPPTPEQAMRQVAWLASVG